MSIYKAPDSIENIDREKESIFLAGSIEMDRAINWQAKCEEFLGQRFNVFNPRRAAWDSSWEQTMENEQFRAQVDWELEALEKADHIIMFFAAMTKSPISLLEFGLYAQSGKMQVVCEDGFWRKGNVDIVCHKYGIKQHLSLDYLLKNSFK
ncbi:nucleoside 2-deoxyribosyltransferase domain-containing protein [Portibacter lacus]|uniref:Nucleoside 2-deoxyribosyltransferase n=1 Tax=Portibacter lacus TaxID=1099794 RepID=A0AA37WDH2_9BACT|nr:nucleoside 2-deoxyribosyltransferase domain-containing protein [Portibacter lacus]GLR16032.1 hypothetical protein GCM10007940_06470 [Portibacter lacus]